MSSLLINIADSLQQFSQERRILRVKFAPNTGFSADAFLPHQLNGSEGICEVIDYRLHYPATDIGVPLKSLIGVPLRVKDKSLRFSNKSIIRAIIHIKSSRSSHAEIARHAAPETPQITGPGAFSPHC
ncbi:rhs element Vgr domain protein [Collimonas fungivorans]|uniref:Rhs element Vgr domain protein n=1 Tax=Collimonas fungivorans TaxID=158899 RepID=A0A127P7N8_9BURK|nr:hypothetical protein [Collimonas fungivorans]AMO93654.1 rhs element Vgr domain protein [Collimonas fungivorans]